MVSGIAIVLITGVLVALFILSRYERDHPDSVYSDKWWALGHHLVVAIIVALTIVVSLAPAAFFRLSDDGIAGKSATVISGTIISALLLPLTVAIRAVCVFVQNALWRRLAIVIIWAASSMLLYQFFQAWLR